MEKFSLKWTDFEENASKAFRKLRREEEDFFDVTLVSDDEHHISAHKLVLSSSSEFFKNILRKVKQVNPVIYLYGIQAKELYSVMDYIYEGEVQLFEKDLDYFLSIAQKLRIEGIMGSTNNEEHINEEKVSTVDDIIDMPKDCADNVSYMKLEKQTPRIMEKSLSLVGQDPSRVEAAKAVDELVIKKGDLWECLTCGKTTKRNSQIRLHAESHIDGLAFPCQQCGNTFRSRNALKCHKQSKHKDNIIY